MHTSCHPTLQHYNSYNRTDNYRQWNAVGSPDDGHKDARNMLRYYWLPINHHLLHLVGFCFTHCIKSVDSLSWFTLYDEQNNFTIFVYMLQRKNFSLRYLRSRIKNYFVFSVKSIYRTEIELNWNIKLLFQQQLHACRTLTSLEIVLPVNGDQKCDANAQINSANTALDMFPQYPKFCNCVLQPYI